MSALFMSPCVISDVPECIFARRSSRKQPSLKLCKLFDVLFAAGVSLLVYYCLYAVEAINNDHYLSRQAGCQEIPASLSACVFASFIKASSAI